MISILYETFVTRSRVSKCYIKCCVFIVPCAHRFSCSERNPLQVDYIPYLDSVAEQVGVRPNVLWLLLRDPRLALEVLLGPCTPYQYRLTGQGQWAGARQAILTQWERVFLPFRTRVEPEPEISKPSSKLGIIMAFSGAALLCGFFYNKQQLKIC